MGTGVDGLGGGGLIGGGTGSGGGVVQDTKIAAASSKLQILTRFLNIRAPYYFNYTINMILQRRIFNPDINKTVKEYSEIIS